jgi:hypothetical protein
VVLLALDQLLLDTQGNELLNKDNEPPSKKL